MDIKPGDEVEVKASKPPRFADKIIKVKAPIPPNIAITLDPAPGYACAKGCPEPLKELLYLTVAGHHVQLHHHGTSQCDPDGIWKGDLTHEGQDFVFIFKGVGLPDTLTVTGGDAAPAKRHTWKYDVSTCDPFNVVGTVTGPQFNGPFALTE